VEEAAPARRIRLTAEQRRESLLAAATEVFATAGYQAGKVADIAARAGVTEPVVFQNFGSKAALYAAVLDRVAGDVRVHLRVLADSYGSVAGLLAHILEPHAPGWPGGGEHGVLFADAVSLTADGAGSEAAVSAARTLAGHLADIVRRGQADGDIRADVDADAAAWLLLSVLAARPWRAEGLGADGERETAVAELTLRILVGDGGRG
jgi:AcrR family transcriptional regulator